MADWIPQSTLAKAVDLAGFTYDPDLDIIYTRMNAPQRKFGYAYGYDNSALLMSMAIDCEPVFFEYNSKLWMIELWKGQYGLETGCEIGVYNRPLSNPSGYYDVLDKAVGSRPNDPQHGYFFDCAGDDELLEMSFTLKRDGVPLFSRKAQKHWWLTGFKWGVYSTAEQLTVEASINFDDPKMRDAFTQALQGLGYQWTTGATPNTVSLVFGTPKTFQPRTSNAQVLSAVNAQNQRIVAAYKALNLSNNDPNGVQGPVADLIADSFTNYAQLFPSLFAQAAKNIGQSASDVSQILKDKFGLDIDEVGDAITSAGYTLAQWATSLLNFISGALDRSSIVEVVNRGNTNDLVRKNVVGTSGTYRVEPPARIKANKVGRFWLKDNLGGPGSEGSVDYAVVDSSGNQIGDPSSFYYCCPFLAIYDNDVRISGGTGFNYYAKAGDDASWGQMNTVRAGGSPLSVAFVWGTTPPPD